MEAVVLWFHIGAGVVGVLLGPVVAFQTWRHRAPTAVGDAYHWVVLAICASAAVLTVFDWSGLWFFVPIAALSYGCALAGYLIGKRRNPGWLAGYARWMGGAYIALITAILVVSVPDAPITWLLPTAIGVPLLEWFAVKVRGVPAG